MAEDSNAICGEDFSVIIWRDPVHAYRTRTLLCTCTLKNSHKPSHPHHDEEKERVDGREYSDG